MIKVGIVSCDKYVSKIEEDTLLNKRLLELGINSLLVSWEDTSVDFSKFNCLVIRSIWGYHNELEKFYNWLSSLKEKGILVLNEVDLIKANIKKDNQFSILAANGIPLINTEFVYKNQVDEKFSKYILKVFNEKFKGIKRFVIKPTISASGDNTFLIDLDSTIDKEEYIDKIYNRILSTSSDGLMIQPYINSIENGEVSSIFIDGKNTHNMIRFPAIFSGKRKVEICSNFSEQCNKLANKVSIIREFQGYLYMRVDMVIVDKEPVIMEVELADPDLLIKYLDASNKYAVVDTFAKTIIKKV